MDRTFPSRTSASRRNERRAEGRREDGNRGGGGRRRHPRDAESTDKGAGGDIRPVILAKPPPRDVVNDSEQEWPSMASAAGASTSSPRRASPSAVQHSRASGPPVTLLRQQATQHQAQTQRVPAHTKPAQQADKPTPPRHIPPKPLRASVRLLADDDIVHAVSESLDASNSNYCVVGVVGTQGSGKSTVASFLAGNRTTDAYRDFIFRPQSKDAVETVQHQTNGIQIFVTDQRWIILDTPPLLSSSAMNILIDNEKKQRMGYTAPIDQQVEMRGLELLTLLFQVCHVIVVVVDRFIDTNLIRLLQTAEMLRPRKSPSHGAENEQFPHIVFVQNKASKTCFTPKSVLQRCRCLSSMFSKSRLQISSKACGYLRGVGSPVSSFTSSADTSVNFAILPEVNFWLKHKYPDATGFKGHHDYDTLIHDIRCQLFGMSLNTRGDDMIYQQAPDEKAWLELFDRAWTSVGTSSLLPEYVRLLPSSVKFQQ